VKKWDGPRPSWPCPVRVDSISSVTGSKQSFCVRAAGEPSRPSKSETPRKSEGQPIFCFLRVELSRVTVARCCWLYVATVVNGALRSHCSDWATLCGCVCFKPYYCSVCVLCVCSTYYKAVRGGGKCKWFSAPPLKLSLIKLSL